MFISSVLDQSYLAFASLGYQNWRRKEDGLNLSQQRNMQCLHYLLMIKHNQLRITEQNQMNGYIMRLLPGKFLRDAVQVNHKWPIPYFGMPIIFIWAPRWVKSKLILSERLHGDLSKRSTLINLRNIWINGINKNGGYC